MSKQAFGATLCIVGCVAAFYALADMGRANGTQMHQLYQSDPYQVAAMPPSMRAPSVLAGANAEEAYADDVAQQSYESALAAGKSYEAAVADGRRAHAMASEHYEEAVVEEDRYADGVAQRQYEQSLAAGMPYEQAVAYGQA